MKCILTICAYLIMCFAFIGLITSCRHYKNNFTVSTHTQQMMDSVAKKISSQGPKAWLNYFENTPSFFMASDGNLVFPDYNTATKFINDTLVNIISAINLKWNNVFVDVLNDNTSAVRAGFQEHIQFKQGNVAKFNGYFTAIIDNTSAGYKFRNLHWSITK